MGYKAKHPVKATETTLQIIDLLQEINKAGVTELATKLDLAPSAVHNHLSTLQEHRYVVKDGSKYRLGLRFLELGGYTRHRMELYNTAKPELKPLAKETGEKTNLMVEEHGLGIYIYRSMGNEAIQIDTYTGESAYLHNTALGKAILAHLPKERVQEIVDRHGLPSATERTITDVDELFEALAEIRDRGFAFDDEERINGLRCVAVPLLDDEEAIGAISVTGPRSRMTDERFREEIPNKLSQKANLIELDLSY
ncbi:IclR family transcriptional regulator [Natrinema amylolyticum]|uniref:IclR family transcriptional regulator n=1 Tax=Natrinema amylolyticum TaxID=2878679 RepID=UPI001CF93D9A|nr:IclR family transcriptional regulator [Natrinema amylolyticum]